MTDQSFADALRQYRAASGLSVRQLAAKVFYGKSYIGALETGGRHPTPEIARSLDNVLSAGGQLLRLATADSTPAPATTAPAGFVLPGGADDEPLSAVDVAQLHATVQHLVSLDTLHGSQGLHVAAGRAFQAARAKVARVGTRPADRADVFAALAELGEVGAWLAYDSEHHDVSRQLALEALLIAEQAGDGHMTRFVLAHLSMQASYLGNGAEGLDLADRVIAGQPRSRRVVGMMHVRRARALAQLGDQAGALAELGLARRDLAGGVGPDDPAWTWWLHPAELDVHEARIRGTTGDPRGAADMAEKSVLALPAGQGRDQVLFRARHASYLAAAGAWRDADLALTDLMSRPLANMSARIPRILGNARRQAARDGAPGWLVESLHEATALSTAAT